MYMTSFSPWHLQNNFGQDIFDDLDLKTQNDVKEAS